jgi:ANTAR domain/GAF domain
MPDQGNALRANIAVLSHFLVDESTMEETLRRVAELAKATVPGCDMVSVVLCVEGRAAIVAGTDVIAADSDERAARGVMSSLCLPLVARGAAIGAINCYSRDAAAFSAGDERIGSELAAAAAVTVANAQAYWAASDRSERMGRAMQSRASIEQAKGILIAEQHCDPDQAFEMLVRASQRENRKLRDIADQIVKRWVGCRDGADPNVKEEQMHNPPGCDEDKVLELRVQGKSFTGIAKTLGLGRPHEANDAFNRAMRRKPPTERDALRGRELIRLDALADGVRAHPERGPDGVARRLRTVARLRTMLMTD